MYGTRITVGGLSTALPASEPSGTTGAARAQHQDRGWWIIIRGVWDDARNVGVFAGTEDQVRALVGELEESRKHVDPYDDEQVVELRGDPYGYEISYLITTATDVIDLR